MTEPPSDAGKTASRPNATVHRIGFLPLLFLFYGFTTAGPFAYESIFSRSGPGVAILFLILVPLLWSIPTSLAAAEMNSILPVQGGFYRWVRAAFGDFWGFQCGWWNWTGTFLLNSAFAVSFMDYLAQYFAPHVGGPLWLWNWLGAAVFLWLLAYANIRGVQVAGRLATLLQISVLVPVAWFCLVAGFHWQHNPLAPLVPPGKSLGSVFGAGLALAMWNYAGYEQLSSIAGEIRDPQRAFLRALAWTTPLAVLTYVIPPGLALAVLGNWSQWETGYFVTAARTIGGPALGAAMLAAAVIALAALSNSTFLSTSRVPFAMAEDGYLPRVLARLHPRYRTPAVAIVLSAVVCSALAAGNVVNLVAVYIWTRIATSLLTLYAVGALRWKMPDTPRTFRVPGGKWGLLYVVVPPTLLCAFALYNSDAIAFRYSPWLLLSGPIGYVVIRRVLGLKPEAPPARQPSATAER